MVKRSRYLFAVFLSGLMVAGVVAAKKPTLGDPAPDFALKSTVGKNLRLSEQVGDVVVLNFGADWCGKCAQDRRFLEDLHNKYSGLGLVIFGVNMDKEMSKAQHMARELSLSFPVLFDDGKRISKLYRVDSIPATVLVDRDGNLRHVIKGYKASEDAYLDELKVLLKE